MSYAAKKVFSEGLALNKHIISALAWILFLPKKSSFLNFNLQVFISGESSFRTRTLPTIFVQQFIDGKLPELEIEMATEIKRFVEAARPSRGISVLNPLSVFGGDGSATICSGYLVTKKEYQVALAKKTIQVLQSSSVLPSEKLKLLWIRMTGCGVDKMPQLGEAAIEQQIPPSSSRTTVVRTAKKPPPPPFNSSGVNHNHFL